LTAGNRLPNRLVGYCYLEAGVFNETFCSGSGAVPVRCSGGCQAPTATLPASPTTVVWGYYSAKAKPALTVHSGDTVRIQTLSTCGSTERLEAEALRPLTSRRTTLTSIAR